MDSSFCLPPHTEQLRDVADAIEAHHSVNSVALVGADDCEDEGQFVQGVRAARAQDTRLMLPMIVRSPAETSHELVTQSASRQITDPSHLRISSAFPNLTHMER